MSDPFCKLFETIECGQILVKIDRNDDGDPEVRFFVRPPDLGVCATAFGYKDTEKGWDDAEKYYATVDEKEAVRVGLKIFALLTKDDPMNSPTTPEAEQ